MEDYSWISPNDSNPNHNIDMLDVAPAETHVIFIAWSYSTNNNLVTLVYTLICVFDGLIKVPWTGC